MCQQQAAIDVPTGRWNKRLLRCCRGCRSTCCQMAQRINLWDRLGHDRNTERFWQKGTNQPSGFIDGTKCSCWLEIYWELAWRLWAPFTVGGAELLSKHGGGRVGADRMWLFDILHTNCTFFSSNCFRSWGEKSLPSIKCFISSQSEERHTDAITQQIKRSFMTRQDDPRKEEGHII